MRYMMGASGSTDKYYASANQAREYNMYMYLFVYMFWPSPAPASTHMAVTV